MPASPTSSVLTASLVTSKSKTVSPLISSRRVGVVAADLIDLMRGRTRPARVTLREDILSVQRQVLARDIQAEPSAGRMPLVVWVRLMICRTCPSLMARAGTAAKLDCVSAAARFVHGNRGHIRARGHGRARACPRRSRSACRAPHPPAHIHALACARLDDLADIRADAVVGGVVDQHGLGVRVFPDGAAATSSTRHAQRRCPAARRSCRVDIHRHRAGTAPCAPMTLNGGRCGAE